MAVITDYIEFAGEAPTNFLWVAECAHDIQSAEPMSFVRSPALSTYVL